MNSLKVVLDTYIYVSSIFWRGRPYDIIQKALGYNFSVFVSDDIIKELKKVLARDFELNGTEIMQNVDYLMQFAEKIETSQKVDVMKDDPDDNRVLECALASESDFVVTQDNHLLKLRDFDGIKIMNPKDFLETINK